MTNLGVALNDGRGEWQGAYPDPVSIQRGFLETLFIDTEGVIDFRAIREKQVHRVECSTVEDVLKVIAEHDGWNCYAGVATRRLPTCEFDIIEESREPNPKRRRNAGGKWNLSQIPALWVDVDLDDDCEGHKHEMDIRLEQLPAEPSMVVWSGAGLHTYWLFAEPVDVSSHEAVREVEASLKGLCDVLGADRAATDASRILRIPGTWNFPNKKKRDKGREPTECVLHQPDNGRRF